MLQHRHAVVAGGACGVRGPVIGSVVDHVDAVDEARDPLHCLPDQRLLAIGRNDDCDRLAFEHLAWCERQARMRRRSTTGSQSSAMIVPRSSPIRAPTMIEFRWLRAVVSCAAARAVIRGASTFRTNAICCDDAERSCWICAIRS